MQTRKEQDEKNKTTNIEFYTLQNYPPKVKEKDFLRQKRKQKKQKLREYVATRHGF